MRTSFFAAVALGVAGLSISLTACQTATPKTAIYDFGLSPYAATPSTSTPTSVKAPIVLVPLTTHDVIDGTGVLYRLGYADTHQLLPYTQSRWTMPIPQLLHQRL